MTTADRAEQSIDGRRTLLIATCATAAIPTPSAGGALAGTFQPSERAKVAGAPVETDLADLASGQMKTVEGAVSRSGYCAGRRQCSPY